MEKIGLVIRNLIIPFLIGILFAVAFKYTCNPIRINGVSMSPTLKNNEFYFSHSPNDIKLGDIVVFDPLDDDKDYVKRVVGLPGDTICIKNGDLYLNGALSEYQFEKIDNAGIADNVDVILNDNEYFCIGDNRNNSYDSRMIGPINYSQMKFILDRKITPGVFIALIVGSIFLILLVTSVLELIDRKIKHEDDDE